MLWVGLLCCPPCCNGATLQSTRTCHAGERRKRGKGDRRSTELTVVIRNTLEQTVAVELLPRSQIDVFVHVLQADGGTRCAAINASMLALAAAGAPKPPCGACTRRKAVAAEGERPTMPSWRAAALAD